MLLAAATEPAAPAAKLLVRCQEQELRCVFYSGLDSNESKLASQFTGDAPSIAHVYYY